MHVCVSWWLTGFSSPWLFSFPGRSVPTTNPRRIIQGDMKDLARVLMEHYRFWYHDQMDVTSQVCRCCSVCP